MITLDTVHYFVFFPLSTLYIVYILLCIVVYPAIPRGFPCMWYVVYLLLTLRLSITFAILIIMSRVSFFRFILFGIFFFFFLCFLYLDSIFFLRLEKFSAIMSSNSFSVPFSSFCIPILQMLLILCLMLFQRSLKLSSLKKFFFCYDWVISSSLSSRLHIYSSAFFNLLLICSGIFLNFSFSIV